MLKLLTGFLPFSLYMKEGSYTIKNTKLKEKNRFF